MNFFKLFFLIVLIITLNKNVDGHGPSRQKVNEKIEINTNPDKVWEIVKNYMKFDWNSSVKKVTVENNDIGSERKLEDIIDKLHSQLKNLEKENNLLKNYIQSK